MYKIEKHLDRSDKYAQQNPSKYEAHMHRAFEIMQGGSSHKQDMSFGLFQNRFASAVKRPTQEKKEQIIDDINKKFYSQPINEPIEWKVKDKFWSFANSMDFTIEADPAQQVPRVNGKYWSEMRRVTTNENGVEVVHARIKRASMLNLIYDFGSPKYNTFWPFDWLRNVQHVWTPDPNQVFSANPAQFGSGKEQASADSDTTEMTPEDTPEGTEPGGKPVHAETTTETSSSQEEDTSDAKVSDESSNAETVAAQQEDPAEEVSADAKPTAMSERAPPNETNERFKSKCSHRLWQRKCDRSKADLVIDSVWWFNGLGKATHVYWRDHAANKLYRILTLKDPRGGFATLTTRWNSWELSWNIYDTVEGTEHPKYIGIVSRHKKQEPGSEDGAVASGVRIANEYWQNSYLNKQHYYFRITKEFIDSGYANQAFLCAVLSALDNIHT